MRKLNVTDRRTDDGRTDGQYSRPGPSAPRETDGQTDGRTDGRTGGVAISPVPGLRRRPQGGINPHTKFKRDRLNIFRVRAFTSSGSIKGRDAKTIISLNTSFGDII